MVEVPEDLDIDMVTEGGCLVLTGSAPVETYRNIILSARSVDRSYSTEYYL